GIVRECKMAEASIYHLDGPQALTHLDSLLQIKELNAIQWVYGAGRGRASDWLAVYRKCQAAKKGIQLWIVPDELDVIMENLRPEGVWLGIRGIEDEGEASSLIRKVSKWR
ncbi:MAG: trimethylamine corrinoid protein 2, partial [Lentisphaerota bacterium]